MEIVRSRELGLFAPNYDMEADEVEGYLEWLHGEHLPRTLVEGSFSAISHYEAIEAPKRFQLLEIMPSYSSFHSAGRLEAAKRLPASVAEMMALRLGQVRSHYAEVSRADGPAASGPGLAIGPAVCLLRFSVALEARPDFNAWLGREHFGEAANIEGLRSFRRYLAVEGEPKNLLLYEFDSEEALLAGSVERTWTTPWAEKISPSVVHDVNSRVLYRRIWSQG
ncbi:MAG: hypothetical protein QGI11_08270 [Nitrospinota bacterium]|nr:hypothetical protein [Nitrospinota bacterium]